MPLSDRERQVLIEIQEWESKLLQYEANDFQLTFEKYLSRSFSLLPETMQKQFFSSIDNWLFHLHSMIQGSQLHLDTKDRIVSAGRIFNDELDGIPDLKKLKFDQLQYIADQQIARHCFYSIAQGGFSGTGGPIPLGADLPAMAIINLRAVQLIGLTYGFEIDTPYEMMTSLKVFHSAILPNRIKKNGWISLMNELDDHDHYFYNGSEEITDITWMDHLAKQLLKSMTILLFRKKKVQGFPLVSIAIGAGVNYQLTKKVTEFAHKYYQIRFLRDKEAGKNEYTRT